MKNMGSVNTMEGTENKGSMEAKNDMEHKDSISIESMDKGSLEHTESIDDMESADSKEMDKLLKAAFSQMVEQEYEKRPKEFPKHQFSPQFEHSMEELLRTGKISDKTEKKDKREFSMLALLRPIRSRRAVLAMVVLMVCMFGATVSGTNPIIVWLHNSWMEQHGDYVEMESREKETGVSHKVFRKYKLAEVPEGYNLRNEQFDESVGIYYTTYVNEDDNVLVLKQGKKDNGNLGTVTSNRKNIEEIKVGIFEGYYIKDSDAENFVLSDGEYMLVFIGNLPKEKFLELVEGLQVVE